MITEALLSFATWLVTWFFDLLPEVSLPDWWVSAADSWSGLFGYVTDWGHWIPLTAVGTAALFLLLMGAVSLVLFGSRLALSLFTGGGGRA